VIAEIRPDAGDIREQATVPMVTVTVLGNRSDRPQQGVEEAGEWPVPSLMGFQVARAKGAANGGKEGAKDRAVFLQCERIENGFPNNLLSDFTTQLRIPGKTKNQVKDARDCLVVDSRHA
jgi:hypothetical protein